MRLHRLGLQAFGPFAGRVEVDVDSLAEQGLFLLHGQTGAGKTSLLDAVCFALYGAVPGDRSTSGRLRSDHAPEGVPPEVVCELTVGGRRLEITRSPAWERPKKKGTGTTTEQARVLVRELVDGEWIPRANRLDEAGLLLGAVLGMGLSQFTQVVLLPQGDFAAFLRAGADERQRLLEKLFGTEVFSAVEGWLTDQRRAADLEVRTASAFTDRLLARVDEASGALASLSGALEPAPGELDEGPDDDLLSLAARTDPDPAEATPLDLAEARLARAEELRDRARRSEAAARQRLVAARAVADAEQARHERWTRYADAVTEQRKLQAGAPDLALVVAAVAAAREAAGLRGHLVHLDAAEVARSAALAAVTTSTAAAGELGLDATGQPTGERALRAGVADRRELIGRLAGLAELEADHATRCADLDRCRVETAALTTRLGEAEQAAQARGALAARLTARREELVGGASVDALTADLTRAIAVAVAAREHLRLEPLVRDAEAQHLTLRQDGVALREQHLDLLERRLAGMAAELSASLAADSPCPVCGATEHPAPATANQPVDPAEVEAARRRADAATTLTDRAGRSADDLRSGLVAAWTASGGLAPDTADLRVQECRSGLRKAERVATERGRIAEELAELVSFDRRQAEVLSDLAGRLADSRHRQGVLEVQVQGEADRLAQARDTDPSVAARLERLGCEVEALEHLVTAAAALRPADKALRSARAAARAAASEAGFEDLDTARRALLAPDELRRLCDDVAAHERALAAVAVRLDESQTRRAADELAGQAPDLAGSAERIGPARTAAVGAERALEAAAARLTTVGSAVSALTGLAAGVRDQQKATEPLVERHLLLDELTGCVLGTGGGNTKRMRLSAYVLAARLEQVAEAATARLSGMSDGRYSLVHTDERGRGGARGGLGLRVVDHWTNRQRETSSLSGGETFLASLSLALGLADVVQAESGGLSIETLFVDEGFGSLDEETLDQVMATLDGLREGGRAVGLVSHVPELRQRIPAQLQVVKTPTGSSVLPGGRLSECLPPRG